MKQTLVFTIISFVTLLGGCSALQPKRDSCADELNSAWQELDLAKAEGFAGTVSYSKALGLLSVAKTMQTLEKFDQCIENAEKAKLYISDSRKGQ